MNCRTAKDRALARRDASLPAVEEAALQAHLSHCSRCAELGREMDTVLRWVQELPLQEPAANFDWRLRLRLSRLEQEGFAAAGPQWSERRAWALRFAGSA